MSEANKQEDKRCGARTHLQCVGTRISAELKGRYLLSVATSQTQLLDPAVKAKFEGHTLHCATCRESVEYIRSFFTWMRANPKITKEVLTQRKASIKKSIVAI